jgi:hypothetical protein
LTKKVTFSLSFADVSRCKKKVFFWQKISPLFFSARHLKKAQDRKKQPSEKKMGRKSKKSKDEGSLISATHHYPDCGCALPVSTDTEKVLLFMALHAPLCIRENVAYATERDAETEKNPLFVLPAFPDGCPGGPNCPHCD